MPSRHLALPTWPGQFAAMLVLVLVGGCQEQHPQPGTDWLALDAWSLAEAIADGRVSAETVTRAALARIRAVDDAGPILNAVIETNPDALAIAEDLDFQAAQGVITGPLHGVPVIIKANIDTGDSMATTAGSLALAGHLAPDDAQVVRLLRNAGAIIIGKANLSEWANFRGEHSSSGWSSLGGQTRNPWVLDHNPCGSSSGSAVAVAAFMAPLAVGTETDGSIICPASFNGIVGIKPTRGSVSQDGIIPISHTQDIAGPMARSVRDAALLLAIMQDRPVSDLVTGIPANLDGIRIGVIRDYYGAGEFPVVETAFAGWLNLLTGGGAQLQDPLLLDLPETVNAAETEVLLYEFKADLNAYLAEARSPYASLADLIDFNSINADIVLEHFGQEYFEQAQAKGDLDEPAYKEALEQSSGVMQSTLAALFAEQDIDVMVVPANSPATQVNWADGDTIGIYSAHIAAVSGYPSIVVPAGFVDGLPVGLAFIGKPDNEALMVQVAAFFEQSRGLLPAPAYLPRQVQQQ